MRRRGRREAAFRVPGRVPIHVRTDPNPASSAPLEMAQPPTHPNSPEPFNTSRPTAADTQAGAKPRHESSVTTCPAAEGATARSPRTEGRFRRGQDCERLDVPEMGPGPGVAGLPA